MSTHPFIPLYVDDFEAATAHLSPEEDGIYNRLLRLCWRTPGCSLPDDAAWIARKIRVSADDFERVARGILTEFFTISRGRWAQRRLKAEYDTISRKKTARKLAGKKGGEAKARKSQENVASNATILPAHTRASPEPEPEPERKGSPPSEARCAREAGSDRDLAAEFDDRFWPLWPEKKAKGAALRAYLAARRKGASADAICAPLPDGPTLTSAWRDGRHVHASTWLTDQRWLDEPETYARAPPMSAGIVTAMARAEGTRLAIERERRNGSEPRDDFQGDQRFVVALPRIAQIPR